MQIASKNTVKGAANQVLNSDLNASHLPAEGKTED